MQESSILDGFKTLMFNSDPDPTRFKKPVPETFEWNSVKSEFWLDLTRSVQGFVVNSPHDII